MQSFVIYRMTVQKDADLPKSERERQEMQDLYDELFSIDEIDELINRTTKEHKP